MPEEIKKPETETTPETGPEEELDEKDLEQVEGAAYEFYTPVAGKLDKYVKLDKFIGTGHEGKIQI